MHKLKHVFQRSQKSQTEENRRSQQFVKRHSAIATTTLNRSASIIATATTRSHKHQDNISNIDNWLTTSPSIDGAELSDNERKTYESWWKDFDPFDLGKVSNHALFKFLNGCSLPDEKLEQILALFKTSSIEEHGLDRLQFFALLRLVAHAQNGRKVSRALVYLGAPIPRCNIKPCNTLRMEDVFKHHSSQKSFYFDNGEKGQDDNYKNHIFDVIPNNTIVSQCEEHQKRPINRQSWWSITNSSGSFSSSNGFINNKPSLQQNGNRRSYNGPYTTNTSIPNNAHFSPNLLPHDTNTTTFITTTSNNTLISSPIVNATDNNSSTLQMMDYFNTLAPLSDNSTSKTKLLSPPITYQQQEMLPWTQTDMSEINDLEAKVFLEDGNGHHSLEGKQLLLTQKFIYESPSVQKREMNSKNPFHIDTNFDGNCIAATEEALKSPFDDNNNVFPTSINTKPNTYHIPPPPVPAQATKPAFPKYARRYTSTNNVNIRRTQSTREPTTTSSNFVNHSQHLKHRSASNAFDIFFCTSRDITKPNNH